MSNITYQFRIQRQLRSGLAFKHFSGYDHDGLPRWVDAGASKGTPKVWKTPGGLIPTLGDLRSWYGKTYPLFVLVSRTYRDENGSPTRTTVERLTTNQFRQRLTINEE